MATCTTKVSKDFRFNDVIDQVYRPGNKEELFNLRHSSARNAIERIFGVLKRRFRILLLAPEYNMDMQARIPSALCAVHNFICTHNLAEDSALGLDDSSGSSGVMDDHDGNPIEGQVAEQGTEAHALRDRIAQSMWDDYQRIIRQGNYNYVEQESEDGGAEFEGVDNSDGDLGDN